MPTIYLGNTSPVNAEEKGRQITTVNANESDDFATLSVIQSLWPNHSNELPAWVVTDNQKLAKDISKAFSVNEHKCVIGKPENWENN